MTLYINSRLLVVNPLSYRIKCLAIEMEREREREREREERERVQIQYVFLQWKQRILYENGSFLR